MGHSKTSIHSTNFYYRLFCNFIYILLPSIVVIAIILSSSNSSALENSATDGLNLNVPLSCTMSGNIISPHSASMVGGTQTVIDSDGIGIGATEVNTVCNDKNGYTIYAMGTTQDASGNVVLNSPNGDAYNILTGTGTSSDGRSSWGMKLIPVTGSGQYPPTITTGYDEFTAVPNSWVKVANMTSSVSSVANSKFKTTYSVYITTNQPAGNYAGQVKYVMLHPYNTTVVPTNTIESAFAAAGKQKVAVTDPVTGQSGNFYRMQDMENAICNAATNTDANNSIQLVDARDNKLYWVTKLQDGKCWMTQNLDLDLSHSTTLTSLDTDLNDNSLSGAYNNNYEYNSTTGVISWTPENTTENYSIDMKWAGDSNKAYSMDVGEWYWDGDDNTPNCNFLDPSKGCTHFTQNRADADKHLSVGNYYNWPAAVASDNTSSLTTNTQSNINNNPQNSICPKGWRLPTVSNQANTTVNSTNEFDRLNQLYNAGSTGTDSNLIINPLWFVRSGYFVFHLYNGGGEAHYWSSTVYDSDLAYHLYFSSSYVLPTNVGNRNSGESIRCVAR